MRKKNFKGRCEKKDIMKCKKVCKTFDPIQTAFVDVLNNMPEVSEIQCNVLLDGDAKEYMTDIVAILDNGDYMVRECVRRSILSRPMTIRLLDISQQYWLRHGVKDWGVVVDAAEE